MQRLRQLLIITVVVLTVLGGPILIGAQEQASATLRSAAPSLQNPVTFKNPLAYIGQDGNVYMTDENSGEGQPVTGDSTGGPQATFPFFSKSLSYGQFTWSAQGNMLAFSELVNKSVSVVESGKPPIVVAKGVDSGFPPSFSPDSKDIAYVVQTSQQTGDNNADLILQIQAVPATGGAPRALGSLVGSPWVCGGDMFDPVSMLYFSEIRVLGDSPMFFAWTKQGYLHTLGCTGRGLGLSNGAKDIWSNKNLMNAALSPDQSKLLAISTDAQGQNKQLNLVDLTTGQLTPVKTQPNVDRAIFSADGKRIIYSTVEAGTAVVKGADNNAVGKQLFDTLWPASGADNNIVLWSMPVEGGDSITNFKTTGRAVGFMSPAHHQPEVAFSVVSSLVKMITAINNGNAADKAVAQAPHIDLITAYTDNTSPPAVVARGGQPSYGPGDEFSIIPAQPSTAAPTLVGASPTLVTVATSLPTVAPIVITATQFLPTPTVGVVAASGGVCPGFLPSRLVGGGQGRVLPGRANRLRSSPETGAIMTNIPSGGVFDVLDNNKVCTSDGIAWWHVRYNGIEGWTAEGVGTTYFLEPYTGGPTSVPPPPGGTFGIVGVTAAVNPASSNACPTNFNFTGQIVVSAPGTVTYRWERSDGATGPIKSWTAVAGSLTKDESDQWNGLNSTFSGWERIHVLTPNDISSNQASFTLNCGGGAFAVTGVSAGVDSNSKAACNPDGAVFNLTGTITTNGAGNVTYKWERSDGAGSSVQNLNFGAAGSQNVTSNWHLWQDNGTHSNVWMRVHILTPNDATSNQAAFTAHCP